MQATLQPKHCICVWRESCLWMCQGYAFDFAQCVPLPWVKDKSERSSEKKIWEQFWGIEVLSKILDPVIFGFREGENMLENCRKVGEIVETVGNFPPLFVPHVRIWITLAVKAKYMWNSDVPHDQFCGMEWHLPLIGTQNAFICTTHQLFCFWRVILLWWFVIGGPPNYNPRPLRVCPPPFVSPKANRSRQPRFSPWRFGVSAFEWKTFPFQAQM